MEAGFCFFFLLNLEFVEIIVGVLVFTLGEDGGREGSSFWRRFHGAGLGWAGFGFVVIVDYAAAFFDVLSCCWGYSIAFGFSFFSLGV
jgi:hypothetical protein